MPRVPGFEERMRFRASHFAHHDARRLQPQAFEHCHVPDCSQIQIVLHWTLQLSCVFDEDYPIMRGETSQGVKNRIDQGRLAASGRADNQDVLSRAYSGPDDIRV